MTHSAQKIFPGSYNYRGFNVTQMKSDGFGDVVWFINSNDGSTCYFDPTPTLRDAKADIDTAIEKGWV